MVAAPCLTLLTDFGLQDIYVGVMKGAIAKIAPNLPIIDLTHAIPPQDLPAARFSLMSAYPYFPMGTVHVAVVDPGVGSDRRAIAVSLPDGNPPGIVVTPDNGLISGVLLQQSPEAIASMRVVELTRSNYWRVPAVSATFHGRDIFAPVAAHLAIGTPLEWVGEPVAPQTLVQLPIEAASLKADGLHGAVQYIDRFGNGVTTVAAEALVGTSLADADDDWMVRLQTAQGSYSIPLAKTYSDVEPGSALALVGSQGWLEIAINQGSAATQLALAIGDRIVVRQKRH